MDFENIKNPQDSKETFRQRIKLSYNKIKPILLRHHPLCEEFADDHTFKLKGVDFCIGCFIGYPAAIITIIVLPLISMTAILSPRDLLIFSLLFLSTFLFSVFGLTKRKGLKILSKITVGIGAAFLFWSIFTLPNDFLVNFLTFCLTFFVLLLFLNGYHTYGVLKICKNCKFEADWRRCPGMNFLFVSKDIINTDS